MYAPFVPAQYRPLVAMLMAVLIELAKGYMNGTDPIAAVMIGLGIGATTTGGYNVLDRKAKP